MPTTLIKIDRESIRPNPHAGETSKRFAGPLECSFELKSSVPFPSEWLEKAIITEQEFSNLSGGETSIKGILLNPDDMEQFQVELSKVGILTVRSETNFKIMSHAPEPKLLYEYEKTNVQCTKCREMIWWEEIDHEETPDGESLYTVCPNCGAANTFDYELEKIEDVIKEENKL